jgi:serine/threonine protein kinase
VSRAVLTLMIKVTCVQCGDLSIKLLTMAKLEQVKRCVGQYEIRETLRKGRYSWVKKGVDTKTGEVVALKFMAKADKLWQEEQAEQVRTEIKSMIKIKSKNVVKLFAYHLNCKYPKKDGHVVDTILLVLEYCPGGELFDILYYTQQLDAKTARTYFVQMMNGLKACHDAGIVHRDIKPQNLLMDKNFQLKITDFELSKLCKDADTAVMKTHYVGSRGFQAPELLRKKKYGKRCDIFSAGVVLFILLTGFPPFEHAVTSDKWYLPFKEKNPDKFWKQHDGCGVKSDAKELINKMLAYYPRCRIEIDDILTSDFCRGETHTPQELYDVLRKKHRETSKRRREDRKYVEQMQHFVCKRNERQLRASQLRRVFCPLKKYEARQSLMTKRWIVRPTNTNLVELEKEWKQEEQFVPEEVVDSYMVAWQALQYKGKCEVTLKNNNPWEVICRGKCMDGSELSIQMNIYRDERGVYYYNFNHFGGCALKFHKFWQNCEAYFIHSMYMTDELDEEADKEDELTHEAVNFDDKKLEIWVDDEGKREE